MAISSHPILKGTSVGAGAAVTLTGIAFSAGDPGAQRLAVIVLAAAFGGAVAVTATLTMFADERARLSLVSFAMLGAGLLIVAFIASVSTPEQRLSSDSDLACDTDDTLAMDHPECRSS